MDPGRRLVGAGELVEPRDHGADRGRAAGASIRPRVARLGGERLDPRRRSAPPTAHRRPLRRRELDAAESQRTSGAPGGSAPNPGAPAAWIRARPRPSTSSPPPPRRPRSIHSRPARGSSSSSTTRGPRDGQPAAGLAEPGSPAASAPNSPGRGAGAAFRNAALPSVELEPPGLVDVAAADRRARSTVAPRARPAAAISVASQPPRSRADLGDQPVAGPVDHVEHVLEAVLAAVVGIGDLEVAGLDRERVVLAEQVRACPRAAACGASARMSRGSGGPSRGSGRSRRSRRARSAGRGPRARSRGPPPRPSPAGRADGRRASRRSRRSRRRRRRRVRPRAACGASRPRRWASGRCCRGRRRGSASERE